MKKGYENMNVYIFGIFKLLKFIVILWETKFGFNSTLSAFLSKIDTSKTNKQI